MATNSYRIKGPSVIDESLQVVGITTASGGLTTPLSLTTTGAGTLTVAGATTLNGTTGTKNIVTTGTSSVSGLATFLGGIAVNGVATFNGQIGSGAQLGGIHFNSNGASVSFTTSGSAMLRVEHTGTGTATYGSSGGGAVNLTSTTGLMTIGASGNGKVLIQQSGIGAAALRLQTNAAAGSLELAATGATGVLQLTQPTTNISATAALTVQATGSGTARFGSSGTGAVTLESTNTSGSALLIKSAGTAGKLTLMTTNAGIDINAAGATNGVLNLVSAATTNITGKGVVIQSQGGFFVNIMPSPNGTVNIETSGTGNAELRSIGSTTNKARIVGAGNTSEAILLENLTSGGGITLKTHNIGAGTITLMPSPTGKVTLKTDIEVYGTVGTSVQLKLPNAPVADTDAANKAYVDSKGGGVAKVWTDINKDDIAIGQYISPSLQNDGNIAIGERATLQGNGSVAIGLDSGGGFGFGAQSPIVIGKYAGKDGFGGDVAIGFGAARSSDNSSAGSVVIGKEAAQFRGTRESVIIGSRAMSREAAAGDRYGSRNVVVGYRAGMGMRTESPSASDSMVVIGHNAGSGNFLSSGSVIIGSGAAGRHEQQTTPHFGVMGGGAVVIGLNAGCSTEAAPNSRSTIGENQIAIGNSAQSAFYNIQNPRPDNIISIGNGQFCGGNASIGIGLSVNNDKQYSSNAVAIGYHANTAGDFGVAIGGDSNQQENGAAFGRGAKAGNACLALGPMSKALFQQSTAIGLAATAEADNQIKIGTADSSVVAHSAIGVVSDARDKTDIRDTVLGLDFIMKLRAVDWRVDSRSKYAADEIKDGSKAGKRFHHGFVAQEIKQIIDDTGVDFAGFNDCAHQGGAEQMYLSYTELFGPLVKAVQEQQQQIKSQQEMINQLMEVITSLKG